MNYRLRIIPLAVALALPQLAIAADDGTVTLPEITVTAERAFTPQSSFYLDLNAGRTNSVRDSAALIETAPGAAVVRNGSQTGIVQLRGLTGDRVNVLVDGMDITPACPNHMDPPLHYITAEGLASLEIIAGITPVSQGGDSIAGSVIAKSAAPRFRRSDKLELFGKAAASYNGSNDGSDFLLRVGGANDKVSIGYTGETQDGNNLKFPGGTVRASGYELVRHDVTLATRAGDGTLRLDVGRHESKNVGTPSLPMDMVKDNANKYALGYNGNFSFGSVEAKLYRHEIDHMMDNYTMRGLTSGMLAPATSKDTGYQINTTLPRGDHTYRLGMEYLANDFDAYSKMSTDMNGASLKDIIRYGSRDRLGIFGEWEAKLSNQWKTLLGLRSDTVSSNAATIRHLGITPMTPLPMAAMITADAGRFNNANRDIIDNNWDLAAQARFNASPASDYEFGIARKTRSPNLVERYIWSPTNASAGMADGRTYMGNLELKPEVSNQLSVGADWHGTGWQIKPSLFYNRVNDYIQGTPHATRKDDSGNAVLVYNNIDAELYGIDGSWQYRLSNNLNLSGTLSYVRGKRIDVSDNLYRIAPLRASINADYSMGKWTHRAEWMLAARQDKVSTYNGETETGGYGTVNLHTRYQFDKQASVSVGIENLLDKYYADHLGGINRVSGSDVRVGQHIPGAGRFGYVAVDYVF